jgi:hypothetical protein
VVLNKDNVEYGKDYISFTLPNLSEAACRLQYHYQSGCKEAPPGWWINQPTLGDQDTAAPISKSTVDMLLNQRYQHKNMLHFLMLTWEKAIKNMEAEKLREAQVAKAKAEAALLVKDASDSEADSEGDSEA